MSRVRSIAGVLACAGALGCGPSAGEGGAEGASGETGAASETTAEASGLDGASGTVPSCIEPVTAPPLSSYELEVDGSWLLLEVADLMGTPEPDLLLVSDVDVRVLPGGAGGWDPTGMDAVVSTLEVPASARAITVGPVIEAGTNDILVVDESGWLGIWRGDGNGRFHATSEILLYEGVSRRGRPVIFDGYGDDHGEVGIVHTDGLLVVMDDLANGTNGSRSFDTRLDGAEWIVLARAGNDPDEPPLAFVNGYAYDEGYGLVWGSTAALDLTWAGISTPFTHMGDVAVDVDDEGIMRWVGIETEGPATLVSGPLSDHPHLWQTLELGESAPYDGLERVAYPEGHDVAAVVDDAIVLVDLECGTSQRLEGPAVLGQLRAADIDGDGLTDLVGRSERGVAVYRTGA